jgi:hypothetical protein
VRIADTTGEAGRHHLWQHGERPLHVRIERQRGLKSFLTWAFFLAQMSAAEQLLTGAAKAQHDDLLDHTAKPSEAPPDPALDEIAPAKTTGAGSEAATASPPASSGFPLPTLDDDASTQMHPHLSSPASASTSLHVGLSGGAAAGSAAHARVGSSGSPDHALPHLLPDLGLIKQMAPPTAGADGDLNSLLGFDLDIDAGGLISANIDLDLGNLLVAPLQGVGELVGTLTEDLGNLLNGPGLALTEDLGTVLNGTGLALGETLDAVASGLSSTLSELTGLNLTDGLAGLLDRDGAETPEQSSDAGSGADNLGASNLGNLGASNALPDDLFAEGQYTEYNIALRNGPEPVTDPPLIELNIGDVLPTEPPAQAEPAQTDQPPQDSTIAELLPLDEFATRPAV